MCLGRPLHLTISLLFGAAMFFCGEGLVYTWDIIAPRFDVPPGHTFFLSTSPAFSDAVYHEAIPAQKNTSLGHSTKTELPTLFLSISFPRLEQKRGPAGFEKTVRRPDATVAAQRFACFFRESYLAFSTNHTFLGRDADPTRAGPF